MQSHCAIVFINHDEQLQPSWYLQIDKLFSFYKLICFISVPEISNGNIYYFTIDNFIILLNGKHLRKHELVKIIGKKDRYYM